MEPKYKDSSRYYTGGSGTPCSNIENAEGADNASSRLRRTIHQENDAFQSIGFLRSPTAEG